MPPEYTSKDIARFWSKVRIAGPDDCWEWQLGRLPAGYGYFRLSGKKFYAHRFAYEIAYEPIQAGMSILHRCDNPPCCNPIHLCCGTQKDNVRDAIAKNRFVMPPHLWGENNHRAKLTAMQIKQIRVLASSGQLTHLDLAKMFGVSRSNIQMIVAGKTWDRLD